MTPVSCFDRPFRENGSNDLILADVKWIFWEHYAQIETKTIDQKENLFIYTHTHKCGPKLVYDYNKAHVC